MARVASLVVCGIFVIGAAIALRATDVQNAGSANPTVYVTKTGTKYHRVGCWSLSQSKIPMKLSVAARSYGRCTVCRAPVEKNCRHKMALLVLHRRERESQLPLPIT